uniref:Uncharacterized protein n=1 Tax=Marmota marmota marmota TaxID=9994 RepID=A0A8C5YXA1_MARMA
MNDFNGCRRRGRFPGEVPSSLFCSREDGQQRWPRAPPRTHCQAGFQHACASSYSVLMKTLVPAGASVPSTTGSYFGRQELSAAGRVSAPAFYVLSAGSLFY